MGVEVLRALLIDLDGTLVDSHDALRAAYRTFVQGHGGAPSDEEYERWNGPPLAEIVAGLAAEHRIAGDPRALLEEYVAILEGSYLSASRLSAGAEALLDLARSARLDLALVTSAPSRLAHRMLKARGVADRFRVVVCGDEVRQGKPAPEPYATALARLGLSPGAALAVEDTATGVRSAAGAGVRTIGLVSGSPGGSAPLAAAVLDDRAGRESRARLHLAGAVATVAHLREVASIVEGLLAGGPGRVVPASSLYATARLVEPPLDGETTSRVDDAWQRALALRPALTDGEIVSIVDFKAAADAIHIDAELVHYRRFIAQRDGVSLGLRALGVSGVTLLVDPDELAAGPRVVLGRRARGVTQYRGCWELVPSGGVSRARVGPEGRVDLEGQILEELDEELVPAAAVRSTRALGLIEDLEEHVVDACFVIEVVARKGALQSHVAANGEYDELRLLGPGAGVEEELRRWEEAGEGVVPTVRPLLGLLAAARRP